MYVHVYDRFSHACMAAGAHTRRASRRMRIYTRYTIVDQASMSGFLFCNILRRSLARLGRTTCVDVMLNKHNDVWVIENITSCELIKITCG